jgi:F-type H+-transporting ATPase subunit b
MSVLRCPIAGLLLFPALVFLAASGGVALAQADHEHPAVAAEEPGAHAPPSGAGAPAGEEPHEEHGAGAHAVDYNQPPLPGFAPGLMTLFIYSLALFVGFLFVARVFVWKPLIAALDQREARVNQAYAEAEAAKAEAAKLLAAHDARMNEVQEAVKGIVSKARQQADQEKAQIIAAAEAEAQALRDSALADIRRARDEALAQLLARADQQANVAAEHVIGRRFSNN